MESPGLNIWQEIWQSIMEAVESILKVRLEMLGFLQATLGAVEILNQLSKNLFTRGRRPAQQKLGNYQHRAQAFNMGTLSSQFQNGSVKEQELREGNQRAEETANSNHPIQSVDTVPFL